MTKNFKYAIVAALLFAVSGFNSAKAITADELLVIVQSFATQVGQAFGVVSQILGDHETRINNIESQNPNLGGYAMGFSADGAPKNVVVLSRVQGNGNTTYFVRSRYASSSEQISINGVMTQRPFIANYAVAETDAITGELVYVNNYIEAPDTENYTFYNVEVSDYDPVSLAKTVTDDTLREDWSVCNYGQTQICMIDVTLSLTGEHERSYAWSSIRGVSSAPLTVNGLTFPDVRLEQYITTDSARARAKGIGMVFRAANNGSWEDRAIFYRANGVTGGSLAGTPFDAGQPLDGLFF